MSSDKKLYIQITTIITFMMLSLSCAQKSMTHENHASLDSFTTIGQDTVKALFATYEKPDCHLRMNLEVPTEGSSAKTIDAACSMIISLAEDELVNNSTSVEEMIRQYTRSYIFNYLEVGNEAINNFGSDLEMDATWMTFEEIIDGKVLYNDNGIFSYSAKKYSYTGGAHGISTNRVASMDLDKRTIITLESLFDSDKMEMVRKAVVDTLNENYQLLTDDIELTDNFYLTADKIVFVYDPMTLAAYSDGEISVEIDR